MKAFCITFATLVAVTNAQGQFATQCVNSTYYSGVNLDLTGKALEAALHAKIKGHTAIPYTDATLTDTWDALKVLDAYKGDPSTNQVLLLYKNVPWPAADTAGNGVDGSWNREHTWPRSYGVGSDGPDNTDLHNLRASDMNVNSARNNLAFDYCEIGCDVPAHSEASPDTAKDSNWFMPPASRRGDVARSLLYMATRYMGNEGTDTNNLQLSNCPSEVNFLMGKLNTLLEWHRQDPPDAEEIRRNEVVCSDYQGNRNPFVDMPELADKIYLAQDWTDPSVGCSNSPTPTVTSPPPPGTTFAPSTSAPTLAPVPPPTLAGSVAIVGFNTDTTPSPKSIAFLATTDLAAGTQLFVTDNAWLGTSWRATEGTISYTVGEGGIPKGTVFTWESGTAGWGTIGGFAPSTGGDAFLVYQGTDAAPEFVFGLIYTSGGWVPYTQAGTVDASNSVLPRSLMKGTHEIAVPHQDNYKYNGPVVGTPGALLRSISTPGNWIGSSTAQYTFNDLTFTVEDGPDTLNPTKAPTFPSPTASPTRTCQDLEDLEWSDGSNAPCSTLLGYCTVSLLVQDRCLKSCGLCAARGCKDSNPNLLTFENGQLAPCSQIKGYCGEYDFVRVACPETCESCDTPIPKGVILDKEKLEKSLVLPSPREPDTGGDDGEGPEENGGGESSNIIVFALGASAGVVLLVGIMAIVHIRRKKSSRFPLEESAVGAPRYKLNVPANPTFNHGGYNQGGYSQGGYNQGGYNSKQGAYNYSYP